jgi:hypothetical protein
MLTRIMIKSWKRQSVPSLIELGKAELESLNIYIKDELSELILVKVPVPWFPRSSV